MGKPITDAIDNLEASIDEGGNWKTFERALELVCSQRVQNVWKAETSKHSTTKRKPTSHTLSVLAWLWTAPEPDNEHQTDRARASFPSSSNLPTHRRPLFGTSLVYVYDGGVIPHRWLISTIPTTAVTPHNNSDTPWGDSGLARSMSDMRVSPGASHRAGGPGGMVTGESDQAGARPYAPNGKAHPSMEKAIADGRAANKSSRRRH